MKIHIIDDNPDMTDMLKMYFTKKGHECSISNDGHGGLDIILNQKSNVILLDIAMPEFSGIDIVTNLYTNGKMQELNIIILTASPITVDEDEQLKKKGVKAILKKPIDPNQLLDYLEKIQS